jgi:hypothetical protein
MKEQMPADITRRDLFARLGTSVVFMKRSTVGKTEMLLRDIGLTYAPSVKITRECPWRFPPSGTPYASGEGLLRWDRKQFNICGHSHADCVKHGMFNRK